MDAEHFDIRTIREKLGWSRNDLANYLGVNVTTVTRLENGVHKISGPIRRLVKNLNKSENSGAMPLVETETSGEVAR